MANVNEDKLVIRYEGTNNDKKIVECRQINQNIMDYDILLESSWLKLKRVGFSDYLNFNKKSIAKLIKTILRHNPDFLSELVDAEVIPFTYDNIYDTRLKKLEEEINKLKGVKPNKTTVKVSTAKQD